MIRWPILPFLATLLMSALVLAGCQDGEAVGWVSASAADSAAADEALAAGDPGTAVAHLSALTDRAVPDTVAEDDARVVRQDAFDRWARIELQAGRLERAETLVERGLALGEANDVFVANLFTTRGRIREADGRDREAARDYHRAVTILETELGRALGDEP